VPRLSAESLERMAAYAWPGNVRELENLMERAAVLCRGDEVTLEHFPAEVAHAGRAATDSQPPLPETFESLSMKEHVETLERRLIEAALSRNNNKAAAARLLEISERALWYKIKRYRL